MDWGISCVVGEGRDGDAGGALPPGASPSSPPAFKASPSIHDSELFAASEHATPVRVDVDTGGRKGAWSGTPYQYMAPEQAWGRTHEIDARTDVFALGGILFHVLTGRAPGYQEDARRALDGAARAARRCPIRARSRRASRSHPRSARSR